MVDTARLEAQVSDDEGDKERPYKDAVRKLWTFAIGRCLETEPLTGAEWKQLLDSGWLTVVIAPTGADWLMGEDLVKRIDLIAKLVSNWTHLNDARQNALVQMSYQLGVEGLMEFTHMLDAIAREDWEGAYARGVDSKWYRQMKELGSMRAERTLQQIRTGEFPS